MAEKLPFSLLIVFALGQLGWSLGSFSVANLLNYFYMPPEDAAGNGIFPEYIPQTALFLTVTWIGLLNFGTRIFDAFTDPLVAYWSDKSESKLGKRSFFLALGALPLALFSWLSFMPIESSSSMSNVVWLFFILIVFYIGFSLYVTPFNALIAEYGHNSKERLNISTWISVTWAIGFAIGNQVYGLQAFFQNRYEMGATQAFQQSVALLSGIAFLLMLLPVLFIRESRYSIHQKSRENFKESLLETLRDKNFRPFLISDLIYWLSLTFIQLGMGYYILVLLELSPSLLSQMMLILFVLSFVFYVPINLIAQRFGKKRLVLFSFFWLSGVFAMAATLSSNSSLGALEQAYALTIGASLPLAIFGILPNAIIADLAQEGERISGMNRNAMYFGTRTLSMKVGISLANLLFPSLLLFGKGIGNDLGVRLTAWTAFAFCIIGALVFRMMKEPSHGQQA